MSKMNVRAGQICQKLKVQNVIHPGFKIWLQGFQKAQKIENLWMAARLTFFAKI